MTFKGRFSRVAAVWMLAAAAVTVGSAGPAAAVGELTQKAGTAGCVSETGTGGTCQDGKGLAGTFGVTVSPDGRSAYAVSLNANAVTVFDRDPATGALTQKAGTAGCVSDSGSGGACQDGTAVGGPDAVAVSPDGTSVYVTAVGSDAVLVFDRAPNGALTQKVGTAGCVSNDGTMGSCQLGRGVDAPQGIVVSPDGATVYVASSESDAVAVFDRAPGTGALTQKVGAAGCVSDSGADGCQDGTALDGPVGLTVSPDGASVYVASFTADAVAVFDRAPVTGVLTQKAGTAGCVSDTGAGGCTDGKALDAGSSVVVSPDGASVYYAAANGNAVAVFDRNQATGALTQKVGTAGCISQTGNGGACQEGNALFRPLSLAVSPDGAAVYAATAGSDGVAVFDRDSTTGALTQKSGTAGCVSETGTGGTCQDGKGLTGAAGIVLSPDGSSVYVAAQVAEAVAVFDRVAGRPGAYRQLTPARLLDTRDGTGAPLGPVAPVGTLDLQILGRGGVPATGVSAVVLNVTVTGPTAGGYITVYPSGAPRPNASNLNFAPGQTTANAVVSPIGSNGKVSLFNGSAGTAHLLADVSGYFLTDDR